MKTEGISMTAYSITPEGATEAAKEICRLAIGEFINDDAVAAIILRHAEQSPESPTKRYFRCRKCGYTYDGWSTVPPITCPNNKCGRTPLEEYVDGTWTKAATGEV